MVEVAQACRNPRRLNHSTTHHAGRPPWPKHNTEPKGFLYYLSNNKTSPFFLLLGMLLSRKAHKHGPSNPRFTLTTDRDGVGGPTWSTHPFRPQWPQPLGGCGLSGRCPQRRAAVCPHLSSSGHRPPGGREGNSTHQETHSKAGEVQLGPSPTPTSSTDSICLYPS